MMKISTVLLFLLVVLTSITCKGPGVAPPGPAETYPVQVWTTSENAVNLLDLKTIKFARQKEERFPVIQIDTAQKFQTIDGFGYSLTGGSATLIHKMGATARAALLNELFGNGDKSIGISYLRVSIGASDLDAAVFSYNDLPAGQTDPELQYFNLSKDTVDLIPVLKKILAINPNIRIMGSPWSAPVWMKTSGSSVGGNLKPEYYGAYAAYFVKYIQAMQARGIPIDAVTPQNEPQHGGNNPSMVMSAEQQAEFVKNHLGPAFQAAGINTKIIVWDHNCDNPGFPIAVLNDPVAKKFIDGSAFHLYGGDIGALSAVRDAHPDKALYFTEQWTSANGSFSGDLKWHLKHVIIGSMRNWSRIALEWNLANDPAIGPHTPGGCTLCKGALTIDGDAVTRNVSYYIVAQAAKFVPPGSIRLGSNITGPLPNVAFRRPDGKTVLIVLNEGGDLTSFNISCGGKWIVAALAGGSVGTFLF